MEDQTIPPHGYRDSIVAKGETICADEQPLRLGEEPNAQDEEQVNEVAEVGEEVVEAGLVVFVPPHGHEVAVSPRSQRR